MKEERRSMETLQQIQTEAREEMLKRLESLYKNDGVHTIEESLRFIDSLISSAYQAGKDVAVEYIEKGFTFSLDELSKSGAEKLKDILNQARNV